MIPEKSTYELMTLAKQAVKDEIARSVCANEPYDHQRAVNKMVSHCNCDAAEDLVSGWEGDFGV